MRNPGWFSRLYSTDLYLPRQYVPAQWKMVGEGESQITNTENQGNKFFDLYTGTQRYVRYAGAVDSACACMNANTEAVPGAPSCTRKGTV